MQIKIYYYFNKLTLIPPRLNIKKPPVLRRCRLADGGETGDRISGHFLQLKGPLIRKTPKGDRLLFYRLPKSGYQKRVPFTLAL
ncbi:MAG: hypothetical protein JL50_17055 [Peptococcaceae bacterium BICA1-7]|nr:MAG: hypothetical protein JL50_17055 [Peptococcaceae bacterium BICA1-7]HBV96497.1 hypothetical protein [Desulfotomaculum sp.]